MSFKLTTLVAMSTFTVASYSLSSIFKSLGNSISISSLASRDKGLGSSVGSRVGRGVTTGVDT